MDSLAKDLQLLIPALVGVLGALTAYLKVCSDRKKTQEVRDVEKKDIETRVAVLEVRTSKIKDDIREIKEDNKTILKKLYELSGIVANAHQIHQNHEN